MRNSHSVNDFEAEKTRDRKARNHLNQFYDDVIDCLGDPESILILGPGETKGEFVQRLEGKKLRGRIAHVRTVDRMTNREFAAQVRELFGFSPPRSQGQPMQE